MPVVKLRGLPWSCTVEDIIKFLEPVKIVSIKQENDDSNAGPTPSVYLTANTEGRPSGEAFIEVEEETDVDIALQKNNNLMGQRYIEVFKSNYDQLSKHIEESRNRTLNWSDPVVRLRGLPYGCCEIDIRNFFDDFSGRFNGEAFVQFESLQDAAKALERHKEKISNRYIEVFRSTNDEMQYYSSTNKKKSNTASKNNNKNYKNEKKRLKGKQMKSSSFSESDKFQRNFNRNNQRMNPYSRHTPNSYNNNNSSNNYNHGNIMNQRFNPIRNANTPPYQNDDYFNSNNYNNNNNMPSLMNLNMNNHLNHSYENQFNNNETFNSNYIDGRVNNYRSRSPSPSPSYHNDHHQSQSPYQPSRTPFTIKMRGLPFSCTEADIKQFFAPNEPLNIIFLTGRDYRRTGEAEVDFLSHNDACESMKCDKKFIGNRYIELFLLSGSMANHQITPPPLPSLMQQHSFNNHSKRQQQPPPQIPSPQNNSFNSFKHDNKYNNGNHFNRKPKKQHNLNRNYNKNSQYSHNNSINNNHHGYSNLSPPPIHSLPNVQPPLSVPPMHHPQQLMPSLIHPTNQPNSSSAFPSIMIADMAKKAFEVFNQYQHQQQQHQPIHLQPQLPQQQLDQHHNKFNTLTLKSNFNLQHPSNNSNRRF